MGMPTESTETTWFDDGSVEPSPAVKRAMKTYTTIADFPLRECPHCKRTEVTRWHESGDCYFIKCHGCDCVSGKRKTLREAIESWLKGELHSDAAPSERAGL